MLVPNERDHVEVKFTERQEDLILSGSSRCQTKTIDKNGQRV